jgi:hypothetical protein
MSEPAISTPHLERAAPAYKDRSTGLTVFGILTIIMGCLAGLFTILAPINQIVVARNTQTPMNTAAILPVFATYGILAVALIWLGIGSIQARRWARALLLIFSWSWLLLGILMLFMMGFFLPTVFKNLPAAGASGEPAMPPGALVMGMVIMFLFMGFFFIVLPTVWIFFYGSKHVKATCEARDTVIRWTDGCPLPVLALCLWMLFGVPMLLLMPVTGHSVMPFFGTFLTGFPCTAFCLIFAAIWSYAAWLLYRLKPQGWWLILIAMIVFMASSLLTFARHDMLELYRLQGYPQAQIEQIQKIGLLEGNRVLWLSALFMLPFLGYLLFVKRYFRANS